MDTYYLVDYENVKADGLEGCNQLKKTDHIIIFFTNNAKKIDMSVIADHGEAELQMLEVPSGKQSCDIHIGSYIGYLLGMYKDQGCKAVVVSKDTDYDNVLKFWEKKTGLSTSRVEKIKDKISKAAAPKEKAPKETAKKTETTKTKEKADQGKAKTEINNEIMKILSSAKFDSDVVNFVASTVTKNFSEKNGKQLVYRAIVSKYKQEKGLKIYNHIKKSL